VVRDLPDRLVGEDLRVLIRLLDGAGVIGPRRGERHIAGILEDGGPPVPAAGQQPQAVDEHDRRES